MLNGLDNEVWDPATDTLLHTCYTPDSLDRKAANKRHLKSMLGLGSQQQDANKPLVRCRGREGRARERERKGDVRCGGREREGVDVLGGEGFPPKGKSKRGSSEEDIGTGLISGKPLGWPPDPGTLRFHLMGTESEE